VRYLACCQLPDDTDITINASGLLDLNGFGENVRNSSSMGDLDTGSAAFCPSRHHCERNTNSQAIISGRMSVLSNPIINTVGHHFRRTYGSMHRSSARWVTKNGVEKCR